MCVRLEGCATYPVGNVVGVVVFCESVCAGFAMFLFWPWVRCLQVLRYDWRVRRSCDSHRSSSMIVMVLSLGKPHKVLAQCVGCVFSGSQYWLLKASWMQRHDRQAGRLSISAVRPLGPGALSVCLFASARNVWYSEIVGIGLLSLVSCWCSCIVLSL